MGETNELLRRYWGPGFALRSHQPEIVAALQQGQDVLALLPTGEGKSLCYQLAGLLLGGLTVVISPLIALMQDQVAALRQRGLPVVHLHSQLAERAREQALRSLGESGGFVYLSPEQLQSRSVQAFFWRTPPTLLVIDEAHCITQWGHDFRPAYRRIPEFVAQLAERPVIGAFTATAPPRVAHDIHQLLGLQQPLAVRGTPLQSHIDLGLRRCWTPRGKWQTLVRELRPKTLIYAGSRSETERVSTRLQESLDSPVLCYHAGLPGPRREQVLERFATGQPGVMVATKAFGMGVDIGDIERVIHWQLPESLSAYVQEVGRAGRDRQRSASGLLLMLWGEAPPAKLLARLQQLRGDQIKVLLRALADGTSLPQLRQRFELSDSTLQQLLLPLEQSQQLERNGQQLRLLSAPDRDLRQSLLHHVRQLAKQRQADLDELKAYCRFRRCRRHFLHQVFDLPAPESGCGHCDRCRAAQAPVPAQQV
ncbi:MAG: RecQ family ATP-dependent DNA helicase [Candidatus Sericytochromatia bacterium]